MRTLRILSLLSIGGVFLLGAAGRAAGVTPSAIDGNWAGALDAGGTTLHLVFHFHTGAGGLVQCTMDSLDQHSMGIPCGIAKVDGRKFRWM